MKQISDSDLGLTIRLLKDFVSVTEESTKQLRELRRKSKLLLKKLEKKNTEKENISK